MITMELCQELSYRNTTALLIWSIYFHYALAMYEMESDSVLSRERGKVRRGWSAVQGWPTAAAVGYARRDRPELINLLIK